MGKAQTEHLNRVLNEHLNTIHETFQVLDQTPPSSLDKVSWNEVIKLGEQVSKQATTVGMLWTGEAVEVRALEDNMSAYFNLLQGFLLLSHGSTVGAGATLSSCIHTSVKHVVDCSFMLLKESVSFYGTGSISQTLSIPQLVGTVWDACSALKKTPSTNITAIGRAMTQVAVSIKDVLREMKELKPGSSSYSSDPPEPESENSSDGEIGNDLSPDEMRIATSAADVASDVLLLIKELIRSVSGFIQLENSDQSEDFMSRLERLLKLCSEVGVLVDEIGACLYPPQEAGSLEAASKKLKASVDEMKTELETMGGSSKGFASACAGLTSSLRRMESELGCLGNDKDDLVPKLDNVVVTE